MIGDATGTALHDPRRRARGASLRDGQRGFTLAALLIILTVLSIVIAFSLPRMWSDVMKRERDVQTVFVMKQYARAIQEFQTRRHAYPVSLDQLKEQNHPRVLRELWPDPLTGKMDWILVPVSVLQQQRNGVGGSGGTSPDPRNPYWNTPESEQGLPATGGTGTGATKPVIPPAGAPGQDIGPFVGVRPPVSGPSYMVLNGADQYQSWLYTTEDLRRETAPVQIVPNPNPQPSTP